MGPKKFVNKVKKVQSANISTAKYLIIVESPSKCSKIESFLGSEYCCIASIGHIRTITDGMKSINTKNNFEPTFSIIDEKKGHIESMRNVIKRFNPSNVFLATDDDREGEAIAWHICKVFDLPLETTPRIIFHEITKPAILYSLQNPTSINLSLVYAQHARQVLDIIVGFKVSPFLWKFVLSNKAQSLSAGRCQTPALRLVYDNQKLQNDDSEVDKKYKVMGMFTERGLKFELNHEFEKQEEVLSFLEKSKGHKHNITVKPSRESSQSPPKPFNTSRLLQVSSNILHISPKETMNLCQQLYQNGHITYMRTESSQYSAVFLQQAKTQIVKQFGSETYVGNTDSIENKDTSKPHEAIRVTHIEIQEIESENSRLTSMYKLIWKNSIESCMSAAKYKMTTVSISAPEKHEYNHTIEIPLFLGWKKVSEKKISESDQNAPAGLLLYLNTLLSKEIPYKEISASIVVRNRHHHYTEASLINKLEELGIGRPSTFASIVETIQERKYVKVADIEGKKIKCVEFKLVNENISQIEKENVFGNEKKKLVIEPVGILTVEFLISHFQDLFDYEYTKKMESELDIISAGELAKGPEICKHCYDEIKRMSLPLSKLTKQAFSIDETHELVFEKYGAVIKEKNADGTNEYIPIKKSLNLDLDKIKRNEYTVEELAEVKYDCLGKYQDHDLYIKIGKFGPYAEWGDKKESIKTLLEDTKKEIKDITIQDIETFFTDPHFKIDKNVLRVLNSSMSVRKGKFGPYVYYKRSDMKAPKFLNIKKFSEGFAVCKIETLVTWLCETYKLGEP